MNDGAAGGERVGGGTGGSGDDQTVGTGASDKFFVDKKFHFDHAGEGALVDDHLVQNILAFDGIAFADQRSGEHDAFAGFGFAGQSFFERGVEFLEGEAGEKAEAAEVNRQDGDAPGGCFAGGS